MRHQIVVVAFVLVGLSVNAVGATGVSVCALDQGRYAVSDDRSGTIKIYNESASAPSAEIQVFEKGMVSDLVFEPISKTLLVHYSLWPNEECFVGAYDSEFVEKYRLQFEPGHRITLVGNGEFYLSSPVCDDDSGIVDAETGLIRYWRSNSIYDDCVHFRIFSDAEIWITKTGTIHFRNHEGKGGSWHSELGVSGVTYVTYAGDMGIQRHSGVVYICFTGSSDGPTIVAFREKDGSILGQFFVPGDYCVFGALETASGRSIIVVNSFAKIFQLQEGSLSLLAETNSPDGIAAAWSVRVDYAIIDGVRSPVFYGVFSRVNGTPIFERGMLLVRGSKASISSVYQKGNVFISANGRAFVRKPDGGILSY